LEQCSAPADERSFDGHYGGPHGFGRFLEGVAKDVLQDDRAALRYREQHEARQGRSNDSGLGLVVESRNLVHLCVRIGVLRAVALQEIHGRVVRDAKQPGP